MNPSFSYKEILMKNSDKEFEVSKKVITHTYSRKDIQKLCTTGNLEQLKKIPLTQFTQEIKMFLLKNMKDKILEIETWKFEDQNQLSGKLEELDLRIQEILTCLNYIESLS